MSYRPGRSFPFPLFLRAVFHGSCDASQDQADANEYPAQGDQDTTRFLPLLRRVQAVELEDEVGAAHVAEQRQERSSGRQPLAQLLLDTREILAVA